MTTNLRRARASGDFRAFRTSLERLAYPIPKTAVADAQPDSVSKIFTHPQDFYRLGYPDGWQVTRTSPNGAVIAPPDGVQASRNGDDVTRGAMFDLFDIAVPDRSLTLEQEPADRFSSVTRLYYQTLFYMVFVAPEDEFAMYQPIFEPMIHSVRLR